MKSFTIGLILCCCSAVQCNAQLTNEFSTADSLSLASRQFNKSKFKASLKTPVILIGASLIALTDNEMLSSEEYAEKRNEVMPHFRTHVDNYIQFAPIAAVYGLNMLGVKGKNDFLNRSALLIKSELIMAVLVVPVKSFSGVLRPDGSSTTSLPSGHTAQAFVAATFLHKEYGHLSAWYSIGGYATAISVGALRILNNKHYVSDVLVGAGIGIFATNIAYMTHQYKWGRKKNRKMVILPMYNQGSLGFNMNLNLN